MSILIRPDPYTNDSIDPLARHFLEWKWTKFLKLLLTQEESLSIAEFDENTH